MSRGKAVSQPIRDLVIEKFKNKLSERKIAKECHLPKSTVHGLIQRYKETGECRRGKSKGRRFILTRGDMRIFRRHIRQHRSSSIADITVWARTYFGNTISESTIRRCISRCKHKLYRAKKKPFLTTANKRNRVKWARIHLKWTVAKWKKVLWSDESKFEISVGNICKKVIRTKDEADDPSCYGARIQKPSSVMVWGCMAASGVGDLHFCDGTVKAQDYIAILEEHLQRSKRKLFGCRPSIYQQDNARPHTARITTAWFRSKRVNVLPWPAASPDLSPIENLWRILKRKVQQRRPRNVAQLKTILLQEWTSISQNEAEALVTSMPARLASVIRRKGTATKW